MVIPKTNEVNLGPVTLSNPIYQAGQQFDFYGGIVSSPYSIIGTSFSLNVEVKFKDQYGDILDSVYDGNGFVTEDLESIGGNVGLDSKSDAPIRLPSGELSNGSIDDTKSFLPMKLFRQAWAPDVIDKWRAFVEISVADPPVERTGNSLGQLFGQDFNNTMRQRFRVRGHETTPDRKWQSTIPNQELDPATPPENLFIEVE